MAEISWPPRLALKIVFVGSRFALIALSDTDRFVRRALQILQAFSSVLGERDGRVCLETFVILVNHNPDSNFSLQQACHKFVMTRVQVCDKFVVTRVQACSKLAAS
ncbi:hypothetical protein AVEN_8612-1 [Araneus ventricosus]|uniref:Uncharacterized protein n=1 Tax=Araneus ventricosus TaxID=182803 RepID=A0A4Y2C4M6_ARAVE|nr:hypothetical protein AVEN_8612-1 [Araneus ventricosus]